MSPALNDSLKPEVAPEDHARNGRYLEPFEGFCVVEQSVRKGVEAAVGVEPVVRRAAGGRLLTHAMIDYIPMLHSALTVQLI